MASLHEGYISVGRVRGLFGYQGWLKVQVFCGLSDRFRKVKVLYLETEAGLEKREIIGQKPRREGVLLQIEGYPDRESARTLIGNEIYLHESEKIDLPTDHYFIHDVIGLEVFDVAGDRVGVVKAVFPAGESDIFVIDRQGKEVLIPGVSDFVVSIEIHKSRMTVRGWEEM